MSKVNQNERAKWQVPVKAYPESGLTRVEYCRKHGIATHQLDYWRKRFRDQSGPQEHFIALDVNSGTRTLEMATAIRVVLPHGITIELDRLPSPDWVQSLVKPS